MADPNSPFSFDYFSLMNDPNPSLSNLNDPSGSFNPFNDDFSDIPANLFDDFVAWDDTNFNTSRDETAQFQEAGPSTSGRGGGGDRPGFLNEGLNLPFWPPAFEPYRCSCCLVLREIIHSDVAGNCAAKLEIHGRLGLICHAILEIKDRLNFVPSASQFHMVDFCRRSIDEVKQYLQDYCNQQQRAGLILVQDPLSMFYEALCVGFQWDQNVNNDNNNNNNNDNNNYNNNQQPIFPELGEMIIVPQQEEGEVRAPRNLALQRERAGRLTLGDLEQYFHLPIEEAARALNLCPTVVKKICRRFGIPRWPHRKIKSYQRQISNLRTLLSSSNEQERIQAQAEIQRLEADIANLRNNRNNQLVIQ